MNKENIHSTIVDQNGNFKLSYDSTNYGIAILTSGANDELQLSFFNLDDPLLEELKEEILNIDINTLTPVEALMKLNEIKKLTGG